MDEKRQAWFNTEKANNTYLNGGCSIVCATWCLEIRNAMDDLQEKLCKANCVENYKEDVVWLQGQGMWCHSEPSVKECCPFIVDLKKIN